jgi:DNA repair protein RadD
MGFLAPVKYYRIKGFDSSKIRVNSTGMDYVDSSLKKYYADVHFDNSISDVVKRLVNAGRNHVLVFTKFVEDARILVRELGNHAAVVSGDMPKDKRENVLNAFKSGAIKVIVNVGVLVLGFDFPALDTVVIGRPTRSLIFWYQTIGRCVRPFMNKEAWVIDMCDNFSRFPAIDRLWLKKDSMGKWNFYNLDTQLPVTSVYFE